MSEAKTNPLLERANEIMTTSVKITDDESLWTLQSEEGDTKIFQGYHPTTKQHMQRAHTIINAPVTVIFELFSRVETNHLWRPSVARFSVLEILTGCADVNRLELNPVPLISSRDFVDVRPWELITNVPGGVVLAFAAVNHPSAPEGGGFVRGESSTGLFRLTPVAEDPGKCRMEWMYCTDIKGWIPGAVVRAASSKFIKDGFAEFEKASKRVLDGWTEHRGFEADDAKARGEPGQRKWACNALAAAAVDAALAELKARAADASKPDPAVAWAAACAKLRALADPSNPLPKDA